MSNPRIPRREFLVGLGLAGAAALLPARADVALTRGSAPALLYPPADLSYFDRPISPAPADIRYGYAAITWGGDDLQAIKDISALGFRGIQLRAGILKGYGSRPSALRDLLADNGLEFVALSSGDVHTTPGQEDEQVLVHTRNAKFLKDAGGQYLQVLDGSRPKGPPTSEQFKRLGRLLTEIGRRVTDLGLRLGYHNHMGRLGQAPDEVDKIMNEVDSRYVKLELDVAHFLQGGGDPISAIRQYRDQLLFLHLKDVEPVSGGAGYRFVELGKGRVDVPGIFAALEQIKFRGWAVVELDSVPDNERSSGRTPKECAFENKKYLEEQIGVKI